MTAVPAELLAVAVSAARAAGTILLEGLSRPKHVQLKTERMSIVTWADVAAQAEVVRIISSRYPDHAILAEEGDTDVAESELTWLVDPLCGTLNYAARTPLVSVNVALRDDGSVPAAAVADPLAGEVLWTDGRQAWLRHDGADEPLEPSARTRLVDVNLDPPFPNPDWFRAVHLLAAPEFGAAFRPRVGASLSGSGARGGPRGAEARPAVR